MLYIKGTIPHGVFVLSQLPPPRLSIFGWIRIKFGLILQSQFLAIFADQCTNSTILSTNKRTMNRSPAACHRRLLSLLFVFLFLWSTNAQRYGSYGKPQHNVGYGGQSSRHGDVEQNNGESGQSNQPWGGWRGRGQWEGQQQQNWGQTHNQEENQETPQGGTEPSGQYPSRWGHQSSGRVPSNVQPQQPSTPEDNDNNGDNAPPSPPQPHSNSGTLHVDLPPGAPGTSDAGNADQSS